MRAYSQDSVDANSITTDTLTDDDAFSVNVGLTPEPS